MEDWRLKNCFFFNLLCKLWWYAPDISLSPHNVGLWMHFLFSAVFRNICYRDERYWTFARVSHWWPRGNCVHKKNDGIELEKCCACAIDFSPTYLHKSSKMHKSPVGFDSNNCKQPELSINAMSRHTMPSFLYSFCSYLNTCKMK